MAIPAKFLAACQCIVLVFAILIPLLWPWGYCLQGILHLTAVCEATETSVCLGILNQRILDFLWVYPAHPRSGVKANGVKRILRD